MHGIGKIERRGAVGQVDYAALRREHEHEVLEHLGMKTVKQCRVFGLVRVQQPAQRLDAGLELPVDRAALLVAPVRRDTVLGKLVHLVGPNLDLYRFAARSAHRSMQRLVAVRLRVGDIIVELPFNVAPLAVHEPEHGVAVSDGLDHDTDRAHIEQFMKIPLLGSHLLPDAVDVLGAAVDFRLDAGLGDRLPECVDDIVDELLAALARLLEILRDTLVGRGFEVAEREVLEFPLELADTETVGYGGVDIEAFLRDLEPGFHVGIAELAQALDAESQLDQHDPDVLDHRQQHAPQPLRLLRRILVVPVRLQGVHLDDVVHQTHDLFAELAFELPGVARLDQPAGAEQAHDQRGLI